MSIDNTFFISLREATNEKDKHNSRDIILLNASTQVTNLFNLWGLNRLGSGVEGCNGLAIKQEWPLVAHFHGAVVSDVQVASDLCVIENTAKVHHALLKLQVREVDLSPQCQLVLWDNYSGKFHLTISSIIILMH